MSGDLNNVYLDGERVTEQQGLRNLTQVEKDQVEIGLGSGTYQFTVHNSN